METSSERKRLQFEALMIEHHVSVRAFVRSLGVDADWVDDIAQEAFLTAFRDWGSFDPSRDFGNWVRGIAANVVRNEIRKDARRRRIFYTELVEILLERYLEIGEKSEPVTIEAIRECVGQLTPRCQTIVEGRYRDDESAQQIAERLKVTAENVRQRLVRIRRQIKQCVELRMLKEGM